MNTRELALILMNIPSVGGERTKNLLRRHRGGNLVSLIRETYPFIAVDGQLIDFAVEKACSQWEHAAASGVGILCWEDCLYPRRLLCISDYPPLIYFRGDREALNSRRSAALIGSRIASRSVLSLTAAVGELLASRGIELVSGLALGCDTEAHKAALKRKTSTIAVMPCGPDLCYPGENLPLYNSLIRGGGAVLSEYPPSVPPAPYRFVRRDRIQSGLSDLVILMDTHEEGGSMHTAAAALAQNRPLFVYTRGRGGNRMLLASGRGIPFGSVEELDNLIDRYTPFTGDCHGRGDQILFSYDENADPGDIPHNGDLSPGFGPYGAD